MNQAQQEATEAESVDNETVIEVRLTFLIINGSDFFVERSALVLFHQLNKLIKRCTVKHRGQKERDWSDLQIWNALFAFVASSRGMSSI